MTITHIKRTATFSAISILGMVAATSDNQTVGIIALCLCAPLLLSVYRKDA